MIGTLIDRHKDDHCHHQKIASRKKSCYFKSRDYLGKMKPALITDKTKVPDYIARLC